MTIDTAIRTAAGTAAEVVYDIMHSYRQGNVTDEEDITGELAGAFGVAFRFRQIENLTWSCSVVRHHKGRAAEESRVGADLLIHVSLKTTDLVYSKGVLVQAKRVEPGEPMKPAMQADLVRKCKQMLRITPASFVFDYAKGSMRCGSASRIAGSQNRDLYQECQWTPLRFFWELFRCPIGDPRITSARVDRLPAPAKVMFTATDNIRG